MTGNFHQTTSYKKDTQRWYTQPWRPEIWVQCIRRYRFASKLVIGKCCLESRAGDNPAIVTDFSGLSQCFLANAGTAPLFSGHNHLLSKPCYQPAIHWQVVQDYKYTSTLSALWQIWLKLMQCHDVFIFFRKRVRMGTIKVLQQDTSRFPAIIADKPKLRWACYATFHRKTSILLRPVTGHFSLLIEVALAPQARLKFARQSVLIVGNSTSLNINFNVIFTAMPAFSKNHLSFRLDHHSAYHKNSRTACSCVTHWLTDWHPTASRCTSRVRQQATAALMAYSTGNLLVFEWWDF